MPLLLQGALVLIVASVLAQAGLALVERTWPSLERQKHNDVAGYLFAMLGLVYGVLMGFMIVVVWQQAEAADSTVNSEANELADVVYLSRQWPNQAGQMVEQRAIAYATSAIQDEWPSLAQGVGSPRTGAALMQLRSSVLGMTPHDAREQVLYDQQITRLQNLSNDRRLRIAYATGGLHPLLRWTMLAGAVIVIGYCYLFGVRQRWVHALMIACVTVVLVGGLFVIQAINHPFTGEIHVPTTAFENVLHELQSGPP